MSASGFATGPVYTDGTNVGIGTAEPNVELQVASINPRLGLYENDASANNRKWDTLINGETMYSRIVNDAYDTATNWLQVDRTGTTVDYVSFPNGNVGIGETDPVTLTEWTHTEPYLTLHNSTNEDTDGGRESRIIARGQQSDGEETILGYMEFAHDGAADDEKGLWRVLVNDGNDGTTPSIAGLTVDSAGNIKAGNATISDNSGNLTSANGLASFDGAVTNITVVNGIITAAS